MDIRDSLPAHEPTTGGGHVTAMFLSLYLLVLAFFILLVTISTPEKIKTTAVMDSLTSTFASLLTPSTDLTAFTANEGNVLAGEAFQQQISGIFSTAVQVAKVEIVQPGRLMQITIGADALFFPETTDIRPAQLPLLDRTVAALSVVTPGLRYDMEFLIGSRYVEGKRLPVGQTLETERAGVFARAMLARGVPPDRVAIALKPGDPSEIVMRFRVRSRDETRLQFEKGFGAAESPTEGT